MTKVHYFLCFSIVLSIFSSAKAASSQCYYCHGEFCNDPFNRDKADVMTCSNSVIGRGVQESSNIDEWNSLEAKLWNSFRDLFGNTEYVCGKSSYYNTIHKINMTIRTCVPKNFKGMAACTYLANFINNGYGKVRTCSYCEDNLCNSGIKLKTPLFAMFIFIVLKSVLL